MEDKLLSFNEDELEVIRELLSITSCGYDRKTYFFHCCDANEIIEKIDKHLGPIVED